MSLTSIFKALPEPLRNPVGAAMMGSLVFHGFLFAGVPLLPVESKGIKSERLVQLVRLSPAEQSRLPQAGSQPIAPLPPPLPNPSSFVLPPLSKLPDVSNQPGLLNPPPSSSRSSANPSSSSSLGSINVSPGRPLPTGPSIPIPQSAKRPDILPSFPNSNPPASPTPAPNVPPLSLDKQIKGLEPSQIEQFSEGNSSPSPQGVDPSLKEAIENQPSPEQATPDEGSGTLERTNQWLAKAREMSNDPKLAFQSVSIPADPKAACQERDEGLAIVAALVKPNGELAGEPPVEVQGSSGSKILDEAAKAAVKSYQFPATGQYQAFLPSFPFKYSKVICPEGTAPSPSPTESSPANNQSSQPNNSSTSLSQWLADARQQNNSQLALRPMSAKYDYPEAACEDQLEGQAQVVAEVKPNGELAEEPAITKSTGHPTLDNAAVAAIKNHSFPAAGQSQAFVFSPKFEYSETACAGKTTSESLSETRRSESASKTKDAASMLAPKKYQSPVSEPSTEEAENAGDSESNSEGSQQLTPDSETKDAASELAPEIPSEPSTGEAENVEDSESGSESGGSQQPMSESDSETKDKSPEQLLPGKYQSP